MPYFFASLKVAITLAFVGSVISESITSNRGIGTLMVQAASDFRIALVFAGLVVTAVMGIAMYAELRDAGIAHHALGNAAHGLRCR